MKKENCNIIIFLLSVMLVSTLIYTITIKKSYNLLIELNDQQSKVIEAQDEILKNRKGMNK